MAGKAWTPERLKLLGDLWGTGLSCAQIAGKLGGGISRNAVIGKARRMIKRGNLGQPAIPTPRSGGRSPGRPRVPLDGLTAPTPRMKAAPTEPPLPAAAPIVPGVWMTPLGPPRTQPVVWPARGQCNWPLGDPQDEGFEFCCRPVGARPDGELETWCESHRGLGYRHQAPSQKGADNLTRALKRYI